MRISRRQFISDGWKLGAFGIFVPTLIRAATPIPFGFLKTAAAAGGGGGDFVSDTMTGSDGTDLTAHTGETGATWAKVTGVTGIIKITGNRCKGDSDGNSLYYASGSPTTAEYDVTADLFQRTDVDEVGICGRMSTGAHTCYRLWYEHTADRWSLDKVVTGTLTNLGTFTDEWANSTSRAVKLQIRDAAKKAFIDGVERISSANNDITAAGKCGIWYNNSDWGFGTTGREVDNFKGTNP